MEKFKSVSKQKISSLPSTAGVYLFMHNNNIIYIGKAVNIRERVKNHFSRPSYRDNLFAEKITEIGFIQTDSEIEALILEANLIKKRQPKFNVAWRDDKNYFYVAIAKNKDKLPYVFITHQVYKSKILNHQSKIEYIGPFVEGNALKKTLKFLRRVFPFYTSANHSKNNCTWCHLELCPGPNPDLREYRKNIKKLILILKGKKSNVLSALKKEMKEFSKSKEFEKAAKARDKIESLEKIMSHARVIAPPSIPNHSRALEHGSDWDETENILKKILEVKKEIKRVECYDISNIQGKQATGSMAVFINGKPDKSQYRKFKINMKNEPNDIAMLKEILERRFNHLEWPLPEVILIDGGKAQLNVALKTKNQNSKTKTAKKSKINAIKVISIAKGRQELFIEGKIQPIPLKNLSQDIYNLIKYLDDEAHRFAIIYHKKLRKKALGLDKDL